MYAKPLKAPWASASWLLMQTYDVKVESTKGENLQEKEKTLN